MYDNKQNMDKLSEKYADFGPIEAYFGDFLSSLACWMTTKSTTSPADRCQRCASRGKKPAIIVGFSQTLVRHPRGCVGAGQAQPLQDGFCEPYR
jgi:hypothetical protein